MARTAGKASGTSRDGAALEAPARGRGSRAAEPTGFLARIGAGMRGFLFGPPLGGEAAGHMREIKGLCLVGFALFTLVAMVSFYAPYHDAGASGWNWAGQVGWYLANGVFCAIGLSGYLGVILALLWGCVLVSARAVSLPVLRAFGAALFLFSTALLLQFCFGPDLGPDGALHDRVGARLPYGPGGYVALMTSPFFEEKFGGLGLFVLLLLVVTVSFMLATEMGFYSTFLAFRNWLAERRNERGETMGQALAQRLRTGALGLWNFLRGADLREGLAPAMAGAPGAVMEVGVEEAEALAAPAKKQRRKKGEPREVDEDDLIEEFEEELEEDADYPAPTPEELAELEAERRAVEAATLAHDDDAAPAKPRKTAAVEDDDLDEASPAALAAMRAGHDDEDELDAPDHHEGEEPEHELTPAPVVKKVPMKPKVSTPSREVENFTPPPGPWQFPPLDVLIPPEQNQGLDDKFLESSAAKLQNALASFRVEAEVIAAQVGPAVTLFELTVAQGTRMNKVTQLSQEIAAALRAQSVRIIAPIPGRETIGIEVPNNKRRIVRISELVTEKAYDPKYMALPIFIGMDAEGGAIVEDLARMPHLLIAGTTGSGKSVCINTILASLLMTRSPHDVKMILVDPKMVELQMFASVPHLMCPVVTDARQATAVLLWAVEKMEGRYELFKDAGVKNIKGYNALGEAGLRERLGTDFDEERTPRHLPYIVVVVDEMADLMATSKKEAEMAITRLAQKSRAAGLHVIVATQRPSTDVITGVIKGNLPTRIAFQVASKIDSRVILDDSGADKLLGNGDMLYMPPGGAKLKRVQGALVEDGELTKIVDFVSQHSAPNFSQELVQLSTGQRQPGEQSGSVPEEDDLYDQAVRVVLKSKRGSASLLQRALGVGYTRASRLIDIMSEQGVLGPHKGSKSRELMMTLDQWEEMHGPTPDSVTAHQEPSDDEA
ncbi:MAG: DNA translocase FtsK 4TM domain-containing protein [Planctomycetes bacterium]|nr:DNA translocase FtsK 4TM domain-containing protein [Planctomycetota bacterium]